ncbi:MAG TPA: squalene synthase HpnC [Gemmataceae bacterium]|nr:squalene synthase HpnC [Gemmataceae bacterium]
MPNTFEKELQRFGPDRAGTVLHLAQARSYCSRLARSHYENFTVASLLLPRRLLRHFHAVYAYCRWADDLADEVDRGPRALELLRWWREELLRCYDDEPRHPVMVALRETIRRFRIPPEPFLNLLFAFEQDQIVKRYQTFDQLLAYCRNSANPVGHLILYLVEAHTPDLAALSDNVCTALQLTNFWQDVARDFDIGRVYLPREDCVRFGYRESDLQNGRCTSSFVELLQFEVERTRDLFYRGLPLLDRVPLEIRPDIELFIRGGLAVLRKIERCRYNVWAVRPTLAKWEKAALLGATVLRRWNAVWFSSEAANGKSSARNRTVELLR